MAYPDTTILLIVDYHAAIGCQDSRAPLLYASGRKCAILTLRTVYHCAILRILGRSHVLRLANVIQ